jgi:hypothetical protein
MDIAYVVLALGFFAASWWLVRACAALGEERRGEK